MGDFIVVERLEISKVEISITIPTAEFEAAVDELESRLEALENKVAQDITDLISKLEEQKTVSAGYRMAVNARMDRFAEELRNAGVPQAQIEAAKAAAQADIDADKEAQAILEGTPATNVNATQPGA